MPTRMLASTLHLVTIIYSRAGPAVECGGEGYLHMRLCEAWEDRREMGFMEWPSAEQEAKAANSVRYLKGDLSMVAQNAPERGKKRLLGTSQLNSTKLPFEQQKFHFGKVSSEEVLLCFNPRQETACQHTATLNTCHLPKYASVQNTDAEACSLDTSDPAVILINAKPVCRNHIVIVPSVREEKPQVLTEDALVLGLAFSMRASPKMWLSFNSIGAGASVNHLHLQGFFPGLGYNGEKPMEFPFEVFSRREGGLMSAATPRGPISLLRTKAWPLRGWEFRWDDETVLGIDTSLAERRLGEFAMQFVAKLQAMDMAHNVLISGGRRVIIFPRKVLFEQAADVTQMQVAGHETLGWWIVPAAEDDLNEASGRDLLGTAALEEADEKKVIKALQECGWQLTSKAKSTKPATDTGPLHAKDTGPLHA